LLMGRVRRLSRSSSHGGTAGERQHDEECGKRSLPVHQSLRSTRSGEPLRAANRFDYAAGLRRGHGIIRRVTESKPAFSFDDFVGAREN